MTAPTNSFLAITPAEIQAGKPCKQELKEAFRNNNLRAFETILAPGVAPDDAAVAVGHRHLGPEKDGTATISAQPQENLVAGSDGILGGPGELQWTTATDVAAGNISFHNGGPASNITPRRIRRSDGSNFEGVKRDREKVYRALIPPENKIKSAGGKGRFTCSHFAKLDSGAEDVIGGTYRFGLYSGGWLAGAFVDIGFDDLEVEYQRFFCVSDQITRPGSFIVRFEWIANPSDWDTVAEDDLIGYVGGAMVTNGAGIAKWDISHLDGGADEYLAAPTDDEIYWWDENIEEVQLMP